MKAGVESARRASSLVDPSGVEFIEQAGFGSVEVHKTSLAEAELIDALDQVHYLGIRSRTQLTRPVIEQATEHVLSNGLRTGDIADSTSKPVSTQAMGDAIVAAMELLHTR